MPDIDAFYYVPERQYIYQEDAGSLRLPYRPGLVIMMYTAVTR